MQLVSVRRFYESTTTATTTFTEIESNQIQTFQINHHLSISVDDNIANDFCNEIKNIFIELLRIKFIGKEGKTLHIWKHI